MAVVEPDVVREGLKEVIDPELGVNIVDLGLIYEINTSEDDNNVDIKMTLTFPGCPAGPYIIAQVHQVVEDLEGVEEVDVEIVWDPAWSPEMMSEEIRMEYGYM